MGISTELLDDAKAIWEAGVAAVRVETLVPSNVVATGNHVRICGEEIAVPPKGRVLAVGAGKAGAGMARGLEAAFRGSSLWAQLEGLVIVPADCVSTLERIELVAGRPAGRNEPTEEGVAATERILKLVGELTADDLLVVLLSGGGSALMPAPPAGIPLADKLQLTRNLAAAGASIQELNAVRRAISRVKGGGLARACGPVRAEVLVLSDIIGDPLDLIASGPMLVPSADVDVPRIARDVLRSRLLPHEVPASILGWLDQASQPAPNCVARVTHHLLANNDTAVKAAAEEARRRGYEIFQEEHDVVGEAGVVGQRLIGEMAASFDGPTRHRKLCWLSGGEPVVTLPASNEPRRGGRNQQLVLSAIVECPQVFADQDRWVLLSGGTDGEDGPTDAAGAFVTAEIVRDARRDMAAVKATRDRCDAYTMLGRLGALLHTGPTHTNVMDLRVMLRS